MYTTCWPRPGEAAATRLASELHRLVAGERKVQVDGGAGPGRLSHVDGAAVRGDDAVRHRQPEAGALPDRLGGEEGFEDALHVAASMPLPLSLTHRCA